MSTAKRPSNTQLQARAREVNRLMRSYVNLHYGHVQEDVPDWRDRSADLLETVTGAVAKLRALDSQTGLLRDGLRGTSYERACCLEVPAEEVLAARLRGHVAEAAADLAEAVRAGDLKMAVQLHNELTVALARLTSHPGGGLTS